MKVKVKVGDLVISKIHHHNVLSAHKGLYFIVTRIIHKNDYDKITLIKCYNGSYQTMWCDALNWEVVSEDR